MLENFTLVDPKDFANLAAEDVVIWQLVVNERIQHVNYGVGTIEKVTAENKSINLLVNFDVYQEPKIMRANILFNSGSIVGFTCRYSIENLRNKIQLAKELGVGFEQLDKLQEEDAVSVAYFSELKRKYWVGYYTDPSPHSRLYSILVKFENHIELAKEDYDWANTEGLSAIMAEHQERKFRQSNDPHRAVFASKCWRDAQLPEKAIAVTDGVKTTAKDVMAMILTTRGAAMVDLGRFEEGERLAKEALTMKKGSIHANALLARIYSEKEDPEKAAKYAKRADFMRGDK